VEAGLAADGVDELLRCFVTRRSGRLRADPPRSLEVRAVDVPGRWHLDIGPEGVDTRVVDGEGPGGADCRVAGPAADLYLSLWNRRPPAGLVVEGDADVLTLFLDRVHIRWS
jgi:hypothetical protein